MAWKYLPRKEIRGAREPKQLSNLNSQTKQSPKTNPKHDVRLVILSIFGLLLTQRVSERSRPNAQVGRQTGARADWWS